MYKPQNFLGTQFPGSCTFCTPTQAKCQVPRKKQKIRCPTLQQKMSCLLQLDYSNSKHSLINIPTFWWNGQSIFEAASVTFISGYRYSAPPLVSSLFSTPSMLFSTSMLLANPWTYILSSLRADKIWWIFQDNL